MNCEPIHRGAHHWMEKKASRGLLTHTSYLSTCPFLFFFFFLFFFSFSSRCSSTLRCLIFILHSVTRRWKWIFWFFWKFKGQSWYIVGFKVVFDRYETLTSVFLVGRASMEMWGLSSFFPFVRVSGEEILAGEFSSNFSNPLSEYRVDQGYVWTPDRYPAGILGFCPRRCIDSWLSYTPPSFPLSFRYIFPPFSYHLIYTPLLQPFTLYFALLFLYFLRDRSFRSVSVSLVHTTISLMFFLRQLHWFWYNDNFSLLSHQLTIYSILSE